MVVQKGLNFGGEVRAGFPGFYLRLELNTFGACFMSVNGVWTKEMYVPSSVAPLVMPLSRMRMLIARF